jgi:2-oxoglutarate ferredoxin oxidoreductase subunit beta
MQRAAANLDLEPHETAVISGIGCSGKMSSYFRAYGMHGVHGRALPLAMGVKLGNRALTVLAAGGDGDGYGIGVGHFVHAVRRNLDLTYIVMDNSIYGLTKGQHSPTSAFGFKSKTNPEGTIEQPIRPLELALSAGGTFVAQGFSGELSHLTNLVEQAIAHKGFALVNTLSPCVTFNNDKTYDYYRENVINIDEDDSYDRHDRITAMNKVMETDGLAIGLLYESTENPPYDDLIPGFREEPIAAHDLEFDEDDFERVMAEF